VPIPDHIVALRAKIGTDLIMMPTVTAIVFNEQGEILLQQRRDNGKWNLPGGIIEPGEEPADAIIREVFEETGLHVIPERIAGVYGGAANVGQFANGDQYAMINITFVCRITGGELDQANDESLALAFFQQHELPESVPMKHRIRIEHFKDAAPFFQVTTPQVK
jgi:8-oxo-dGTP diphosphatase